MTEGGNTIEFDSRTENWQKPKRNAALGVGIFVGFSAVVGAVLGPFVLPGLRRICLPYIPATDAQVCNLLQALQGSKPSSLLLDIGSGDGRIVHATARAGFHSHGVERNFWLVLYSRWKAWKSGCYRNCTFLRGDLFKLNMAPYDSLIVFGGETLMDPLKAKLQKEMKPSASLYACRFPLPYAIPHASFGCDIDTVWLYRQKDVIACGNAEHSCAKNTTQT